MQIKYIIISVIAVAMLSMGAFADQKIDNKKKHGQAEPIIHAEGEETEHGTHDHEEHNELNSQKTDDHDDHDEKKDEEDHGEEVVQLTDAELLEFGIILDTAKPGNLNQFIELPGEIVLNSDRIAHVVPRVAGIVKDVRATVGDHVEKGQLLVTLESRELAETKAAYLAAVERETMARANFKREERLWSKQVTSEQEYLNARQVLSESRITRHSVEQQLHALGYNENQLRSLMKSEHASYTHYTITAPFEGTIIEKHISFGENIGSEASVFTIADLSSVWVNIDIYQKDLSSIRKGQAVQIKIGHNIPSVEGKIAWVGPQIDEETRTAKARVELSNPNGSLRPGLFVTAKVAVGSSIKSIVVPKSALQTFEGRTVVFVQSEKGFEPVPVTMGQKNGESVEILSGLALRQTYVSQGAFTLKAQLSKNAFGDGHNH